jgi:serine O-acetyltransferase
MSARQYIRSVFERDPAAKSVVEVVLCYPGLHAIAMHRINNWLWTHGLRTPARFGSHVARFLTGIEIHPGAQIGKRFFVDHGMGVVVGETAIVGDDVTLYQGVTLGGTGKEAGKRHPTVGSNVVIGGGSKILGNITIGENSRVGAGSVVLRDVPANSTVVGVPAKVVFRDGKRVVIDNPKDVEDPVTKQLEALAREVRELKEELQEMREKQGAPAARNI